MAKTEQPRVHFQQKRQSDEIDISRWQAHIASRDHSTVRCRFPVHRYCEMRMRQSAHRRRMDEKAYKN